jgi:hypothetical protein
MYLAVLSCCCTWLVKLTGNVREVRVEARHLSDVLQEGKYNTDICKINFAFFFPVGVIELPETVAFS